jgi:uncharacterized protein YbjQ (UPF0145 family)
MLITTTPGIEGRPVTKYLGVVTAQGVLGVYPCLTARSGTQRARVRGYPPELVACTFTGCWRWGR